MIIENKYENGQCLGYFGAFEKNKTIKFCLEIPRLRGVSKVFMHLSADGINSQFYDENKDIMVEEEKMVSQVLAVSIFVIMFLLIIPA